MEQKVEVNKCLLMLINKVPNQIYKRDRETLFPGYKPEKQVILKCLQIS